MRASGPLLVSACSLFACSNLLGYDDLSFEDSDAAAGVGGKPHGQGGTSTGGGGSGGAAASGGGGDGGTIGTGASSGTGGIGNTAGVAGSSTGGVGNTGATGGVGNTGGTGGSGNTGGSGGLGGTAATMCQRWNGDRADLSEGTWSGNASTCNAGDITANGRTNTLKLVNLYRWLAALPSVTDDPTKNSQSQQCALMMQANGQLSHTPPTNWKCYTSAGASAAGQSNLSTTPAVAAVDLYMADPGNPSTIGHRRWVLSNSLGPVGIGSTTGYSCLMVIGGSGSGSNPWTAFPPPGPVPFQMFSVSFSSLDSTGWTIQSDSINLQSAAVTVTDAGAAKPVTITQLAGGYGSNYAIRFNPQGWTTQAGHTYSVNVTGIGTPISYDVEVVSCN